MRRLPNEPVTFAARVDREEKNIMDNLLPMQGGRKWAAEIALEEFCSLCEANKALQSWVHDQIMESRAKEPPRGGEDFTPRVRYDLYERFNKMFGQKGATSWFLREFITNFIEVMEGQTLAEELVKRATHRMLKQEVGT